MKNNNLRVVNKFVKDILYKGLTESNHRKLSKMKNLNLSNSIYTVLETLLRVKDRIPVESLNRRIMNIYYRENIHNIDEDSNIIRNFIENRYFKESISEIYDTEDVLDKFENSLEVDFDKEELTPEDEKKYGFSVDEENNVTKYVADEKDITLFIGEDTVSFWYFLFFKDDNGKSFVANGSSIDDLEKDVEDIKDILEGSESEENEEEPEENEPEENEPEENEPEENEPEENEPENNEPEENEEEPEEPNKNESRKPKGYIKSYYEKVNNKKKWSSEVKTKWTPPKGLFSKGTAKEISDVVLKGHKGNAGSAIKSIEYYKNRAGSNLSSKRKNILNRAISNLKKLKKESKDITTPDYSTDDEVLIKDDNKVYRIQKFNDDNTKAYVVLDEDPEEGKWVTVSKINKKLNKVDSFKDIFNNIKQELDSIETSLDDKGLYEAEDYGFSDEKLDDKQKKDENTYRNIAETILSKDNTLKNKIKTAGKFVDDAKVKFGDNWFNNFTADTRKDIADKISNFMKTETEETTPGSINAFTNDDLGAVMPSYKTESKINIGKFFTGMRD